MENLHENITENEIDIETISYTFIVPVICFIGAFLNMICVRAFLRLKMKSGIFKWMLANSVTNVIYLIQCGFIFLYKCGEFCTFSDSYLSVLYQYLSFSYFTSVLALFSILIELTICLQRYLTISNVKVVVFTKSTGTVLTCYFFLCNLLYSLLFIKKLIP